MNRYDFAIIGAGLFGAACSHLLRLVGKTCIIVEKNPHIGGNCYSKSMHGIEVHMHGPHIFHTSDKEIWNFVNKFAEFMPYVYSPVANYHGNIYTLPINLCTFKEILGLSTLQEVERYLNNCNLLIDNPKNLEEQAIKIVGPEIYEKLIKGYTEKQWKKSSKDLPPEIVKRLVVRLNHDNNYFNDTYQGIPKLGYTDFIKNMIGDTPVFLDTDYLLTRVDIGKMAKRIIFSGPVDLLCEYQFGKLEYKYIELIHEVIEEIDHQGTAVVNFTDFSTPYTRSIEHKHFDSSARDLPITIVSKEYSVEQEDKISPSYPVNDQHNNTMYRKYQEFCTENFPEILLGGRLGEYKYYDMDKTIKSAMEKIRQWL